MASPRTKSPRKKKAESSDEEDEVEFHEDAGGRCELIVLMFDFIRIDSLFLLSRAVVGDIYIPPPPPPPKYSGTQTGQRLVITHITNVNFKSYAGERVLGPFHKVIEPLSLVN